MITEAIIITKDGISRYLKALLHRPPTYQEVADALQFLDANIIISKILGEWYRITQPKKHTEALKEELGRQPTQKEQEISETSINEAMK